MTDLNKIVKLFKDDYGNLLVLTPGQLGILKIILKREPKRSAIKCATQYGKSLTIALGILLRLVVFPDRWAIIGATKSKAGIIQGYIIQHIFDDPFFWSQLEIDMPLERLKRERSRERLTFREGGEVRIYTADVRNRKNLGESLIGFGAPNVIEDDSALIDDDIHALVMRMIGGHKDNFLMQIGNPFRRNHFLRAFQSDRYHKITIDYKQGVQEGRFSPEFIEEMRKEAFFKVLYECEFPQLGEIDEQGWSVLLTDKEVEQAMYKNLDAVRGEKKLGVDIGRGGNYTVFVLRTDNYAKILEKNRDPDLMAQVGRIKRIMESESVSPENVFIDDVGVGGGVTDRLKEQEYEVEAVKEGEKAQDSEKFVNVRAEAYWELRKWILEGGALGKNEDWYQLCEIRYKEDSSSRLKIESKEEMRKKGLDSPDVADALMLTFGKERMQVRLTWLDDGNAGWKPLGESGLFSPF